MMLHYTLDMLDHARYIHMCLAYAACIALGAEPGLSSRRSRRPWPTTATLSPRCGGTKSAIHATQARYISMPETTGSKEPSPKFASSRRVTKVAMDTALNGSFRAFLEAFRL